MIKNRIELEVTLQRIDRFRKQATHLRNSEPNPENYRQSVGGYLAEIDRMQLEVREYLLAHPTELAAAS